MCKRFSKEILRFSQLILAIFFLGIGGFAIYAGVIFKDLDFLKDIQKDEDQEGVGGLMSDALYFSGAGIVLYGIITLVNTFSSNKVLTVIFIILTLLVYLAFLAVGIGSLYTYGNFFNQDQVIPDQFDKACNFGEDNTLAKANKAYKQASQYLCGDNCPCKIVDASS